MDSNHLGGLQPANSPKSVYLGLAARLLMQSNVWLAIILLTWASAQQAGAQEEHAKRPPPVSVQAVGPYTVGGGARYSADIQPFRQVDLAFNSGFTNLSSMSCS